MLGGNVRRRLQATARFHRRTGIDRRAGWSWPRDRGFWPPGRGFWWGAGVLLLVLAGIITWVVWPAPDEPQPRARQYRDVTACLLTDERGVTGPQAAPVWAGMQQASLTTLAKVQFLEVDGTQSVDNAQTYLASLVQSRCDLVLAVGEAQVAAVAATAPRHPNTRFVAVGGAAAGANVSVVPQTAPDEVRDAVNALVTEAFGKAPKG